MFSLLKEQLWSSVIQKVFAYKFKFQFQNILVFVSWFCIISFNSTFDPNWVNSDYITYGVNSLRLGGLCIKVYNLIIIWPYHFINPYISD